MELFKTKRGAQNNMGIIILVVIGFLLFKGGAFGTQSTVGTGGTTTVVQQPQPVTLQVQGGCNVEDTTVSFNHVNLYSQGTTVTQGARILLFDGEMNSQVANGGSKTFSPGDQYKVLSGNLTTALTGGTDYYPQYHEGALPCGGTTTIQGKLAMAESQANTIFTYWNSNEQANTAQALGANDVKTAKIRFAVGDNRCFGNPYAAERGGKNIMCLTASSSNYASLELVTLSGTPIEAAPRPKAATAVAGNDTWCYQWDVICDNNEFNAKLIIKAATEPVTATNISISLHDVSFDFDADTLALITGVEDEARTRNDIGVADYNTGANWAYSIATS